MPDKDLPPDFCRYPDEGCELAPSCLCCPFPSCVEDMPRGKQRYWKRLRDQEMVRLFHQDKARIREIACHFGVSSRTVQRALRRAREV